MLPSFQRKKDPLCLRGVHTIKNADKVKDTTTRFFKKHAEKLTAEKENKKPSE